MLALAFLWSGVGGGQTAAARGACGHSLGGAQSLALDGGAEWILPGNCGGDALRSGLRANSSPWSSAAKHPPGLPYPPEVLAIAPSDLGRDPATPAGAFRHAKRHVHLLVGVLLI